MLLEPRRVGERCGFGFNDWRCNNDGIGIIPAATEILLREQLTGSEKLYDRVVCRLHKDLLALKL